MRDNPLVVLILAAIGLIAACKLIQFWADHHEVGRPFF